METCLNRAVCFLATMWSRFWLQSIYHGTEGVATSGVQLTSQCQKQALRGSKIGTKTGIKIGSKIAVVK